MNNLSADQHHFYVSLYKGSFIFKQRQENEKQLKESWISKPLTEKAHRFSKARSETGLRF